MTVLQVEGPSRRARRSSLRRRQVSLSLAALTAIAGVVALGAGGPAGWVAFAATVVVDATYAAMVHRATHLAVEREFRLSMSGVARPMDDLEGLRLQAEGGEVVVEVVATPSWRQAVALIQFVASVAAGWALAPLVFALTILVGRTPRDTTGQRWLANLQRAQVQMKEQSLRTLAVSAATTASVTGVGSLAFGASPVSATPIAATAPLPASAPMPAASPLSTSVYRVAAGDTLGSIAPRFSTTVDALAALNHISDPNLIYAGQVIKVPSSVHTVLATQEQAPSAYTVKTGDTLSAIAAHFGMTVDSLASINSIGDPNMIYAGQVLKLHGAPAARPATIASARPATPGPATHAATATNHAAPATNHAAPAPARTSTSAPAPAPAPAKAIQTKTVAAANAAEMAVETAMAQIGKPYVWGGAGPGGFDCSGLVMYAWAKAGVQLAHYTVTQYEETTRISQSQLQPGDLVFYNTGDGANPGHVTMYLGNGQVITADSPGTTIKVVSLTWDGPPMGFGRVR